MTQPSNQELERRFAEHNISRHRLYPWWYLLYRRFGMKQKPPVLFSLAEHFRYEGTSIAFIFVMGMGVNWYFWSIPPQAHVVIFLMIFLIPLWNWWGYRRIRRRIGL
jgi:hypothetical protein